MPAIGLFARYPTPGKVKTRLAASVGNEMAASVYKECAELMVESLRETNNIERYVFLSDNDECGEVMTWIGPGFEYREQIGGDLAERLENAFSMLFAEGADKAIIAATDTPEISAEVLHEALAALNGNDIVIGPARDGGYYLIGMNESRPELFSNAVMGTDSVFREARQRAAASNLSVAVLGELGDIDTLDDLRLWREKGNRERV